MKATNFVIQNFKGVLDRSDALGKVTVLIGENGTGKSSYLEGIRYALTGETDTSVPLTVGAENGKVLLAFDDGTSVGVATTEKGTFHLLNGKRNTKANVGIQRQRILNIDPDIVSILLGRKENVFGMKPERFASIFLGLMQKRVPVRDVADGCEFSKEKYDVLKEVFPYPDLSLKDIEKVYEIIGAEITALKKETAQLLARTISAAEKLPAESKEELEKQLNDALGVLSDAREYDRRYREYNVACQKRSAHLAEMETLKKAIETPVDAPDEKQTASLNDRVVEINRARAMHEAAIAQMTAMVEQQKKLIEQLASSVCPLSRSIVCTTDKSGIRAELQEGIDKSTHQIETLRSEVVRLDAENSAIVKQITELRNQASDYARYKHSLEVYKMYADNVPPEPQEPVLVFGGVEAASQAVAAIQQGLESIRRAEDAKAADALYTEKMKRQMLFMELRTDFAPKGPVYNWILSRMVDVLSDTVNKRASEMGIKHEYGFVVDNGLQMVARRDGMGAFIPVCEMSDGEQFVSQFLLLDLVNAWVGLGFVVLDNIDCLDAYNLTKLLSVITKPCVLDNYNNIFLAGLPHPDTIGVVSNKSSDDVVVMRFR